MRFWSAGCLLAVLVAAIRPALAAPAGASTAVRTVLVLPFENESRAPGLEWIRESFPEVLGERLAAPSLSLVSRNQRLRAFDRAGIPANLRLSRASKFRLAEQMEAGYLVLGAYNFDGQTFTASAQLLDLKREHLIPEVRETGPLADLVRIETVLAWNLRRALDPGFQTSREAFVAATPPVRLDALENYIRGLSDSSPQEKLHYLREATRLDPGYIPPRLELGKTLLAQGLAEPAAWEFRRVLALDSSNAAAHSGLAEANEALHDAAGARSEAEAALRIRPSAQALLVLARLDLSDKKTEDATRNLERALQLEPANASALALKRVLAAKPGEKAQPLNK